MTSLKQKTVDGLMLSPPGTTSGGGGDNTERRKERIQAVFNEKFTVNEQSKLKEAAAAGGKRGGIVSQS